MSKKYHPHSDLSHGLETRIGDARRLAEPSLSKHQFLINASIQYIEILEMQKKGYEVCYRNKNNSQEIQHSSLNQ